MAHPLRSCTGSPRSGPPGPAEKAAGASERTAGRFTAGLLAASECDGDVAVITVRGEIDFATAPVVLEVLRNSIEHDGGPVVVDLSEVTFMDSAGVHLLLDTLRRLESQDRRLAIACGEGSQVHRLLAVLGLLDIVAVHRSRESAVTAGKDRILSERSPRTLCAV